MTFLTVFIGGLIAAPESYSIQPTLIGAAVAAALIAAGANAINDAYDAVIDLINRPDRPIPAGDVSRISAAIWGWMLTALGVTGGWLLSRPLGVIALAVAYLLWIYSSRLKKRPLSGNIAVALCGGLAFIYGGIAVGSVKEAVIPALFAFLIHLGREIVKDVEDEAGDRAAGARTLPIVIGRLQSLKIAAGVLLSLALAAPVPHFFSLYRELYLFLILPMVSIPLVLVAVLLLREPDAAMLRRISNGLKIIMLTGLASLYAG